MLVINVILKIVGWIAENIIVGREGRYIRVTVRDCCICPSICYVLGSASIALSYSNIYMEMRGLDDYGPTQVGGTNVVVVS